MLEFLRALFNPMAGIKFGEVDSDQIIDNEYKIKFLTRIVTWLINNVPPANRPTQDMIQNWQNEALEEVRRKYPNSGINLNP